MHRAAQTPSTQERILDAAAQVFARQGLEGATTREIALHAKVNEVTLFRHFLNKEKLLDAVLKRTFDQQDEAAQAPWQADGTQTVQTAPGLRAELLRFARRYEVLLRRNIVMLRTLLGEIHRHREHEARMLQCIFAPLKAELTTLIKRGRDSGEVRPAIEPTIAADLFAGTVFVDVLRRSLHSEPGYPTEKYLEVAVEVFARGVEP